VDSYDTIRVLPGFDWPETAPEAVPDSGNRTTLKRNREERVGGESRGRWSRLECHGLRSPQEAAPVGRLKFKHIILKLRSTNYKGEAA
jgi:hypothetical protein